MNQTPLMQLLTSLLGEHTAPAPASSIAIRTYETVQGTIIDSNKPKKTGDKMRQSILVNTTRGTIMPAVLWGDAAKMDIGSIVTDEEHGAEPMLWEFAINPSASDRGVIFNNVIGIPTRVS